MSQHQYYPQLKWKPAEYESLMLLDQTTLSGFTPIITIPDIDWDYENECYKKSLSSYLSDFGINLAASWKANRPVLLDVKYLDKHGSSRHHPLDMCSCPLISRQGLYLKLTLPADVDILAESDNPTHYADGFHCNARSPLQGYAMPFLHSVSA